MKSIKKCTAVLLILALALSTGACSGGSIGSQADAGNTERAESYREEVAEYIEDIGNALLIDNVNSAEEAGGTLENGGIVVSVLNDNSSIEPALMRAVSSTAQDPDYKTVATLYYNDGNNTPGTYRICISNNSQSVDIQAEIEDAMKYIDNATNSSTSAVTSSTVALEFIGSLSTSVVEQPKGKMLITHNVYTEQDLVGLDYYYVQTTINATPGAALNQDDYEDYTGSRLELCLNPVSPNSAIVEEYDPRACDSDGQYTVGIGMKPSVYFTLHGGLSYTGTIPGSSINATCDNRKTDWTVDINDAARRTDGIVFAPAALIRCGHNTTTLTIDASASYRVKFHTNEYIDYDSNIICTPSSVSK